MAQVVKSSAYNAGDLGSIPGLGRSPGEGNGNPFQYSCLENPLDRGAWWATVHEVTQEPDMREQLNKQLSHIQLFVTPWTVAHQATLSVGFPRREYWSGLSYLFPGDLPDLGIEFTSPALAGGFFTTELQESHMTHLASFT